MGAKALLVVFRVLWRRLARSEVPSPPTQGRVANAFACGEALGLRHPHHAHYKYWGRFAAFYAVRRAGARHWIEQAFSLEPDDSIAQCVFALELAADGTFTFWIAKVHALLGDEASAIA